VAVTRLVVANHFPVLPARGGGQLAVLGLARQLAAAWPTELVWTERRRSASFEHHDGTHRLAVTVVPSLWLQRQAARALRHWLGAVEQDLGSALVSGWNQALVGHLRRKLRDGDVLVAAHPWLWPALRRVCRRRRLLLVYDAHNVEHELKRATLLPSPVSRWLVEHVRRLERDLVRQADLVLACTEADADALAALGDIDRHKLLVGSKGIEPSSVADAMAADRSARPPGRLAVFVGSEHPPNNEAARWIGTELARACGDWQFAIAGACGPAARIENPPANVQVLGRVDDLDALLARADVALNPMQAGSGINMKLFEALRAGLPVLSTALGARGFERVGSCGIRIASREQFAAQLRSLGTDPAAWRRLSREGPDCVRRHFAWPVIGERVRARIAALLAEGRR
jgi:glycosyltransferase involved in cell wall biosynthesis